METKCIEFKKKKSVNPAYRQAGAKDTKGLTKVSKYCII